MKNNFVLDVKFNRYETRNIIIYIVGLMLYKFAFESLSGSVGLLAQQRFGGTRRSTFLSLITSSYYIMQCVFSLAVAQLVRRFHSNRILAASVLSMGLVALCLIILEAATGGTFSTRGSWNIWILLPVYSVMGGFLGILELIRRIIPRDIVGNNEEKLKKMDAFVHIFYEVAGTAGAFFSAYFIELMDPVYSLSLIPVFFSIAAVMWYMLDVHTMTGLQEQREQYVLKSNVPASGSGPVSSSVLASVWRFIVDYFHSVKTGALIVFRTRRLSWLFFGYTVPLVLHRFIENIFFPVFAKNTLKDGALSGILLGGSNLGELIGASCVLLFSKQIATPLPWVRADAVALSIMWIYPLAIYIFPSSLTGAQMAWCIAPFMCILSCGWAAGDVSLSAFIQSTLGPEAGDEDSMISPLGAVMAFLYSSYILLFTIAAPLAALVFDTYLAAGNIQGSYIWVVGVGIAVVFALIIFGSTFWPEDSWALNPKLSVKSESEEELHMEMSPAPENGDSDSSFESSLSKQTCEN